MDKHPEDCFKTHADLKHNNFLKPDTYNLYGLGLSNPLSPFFLFILKSSTRRTLLSDRQHHHPRSMGPSSRRLPPLPRAHLRSGSAPPESSIFGRPPQRGYPPSSIQPARRASRRRHTHPSHTDTAPGAPLACFPREGRSSAGTRGPFCGENTAEGGLQAGREPGGCRRSPLSSAAAAPRRSPPQQPPPFCRQPLTPAG